MVDGNETKVRELESALQAACRWLLSYVDNDVRKKQFDYERARERDKLAPEYLRDLRQIRRALGRD